MKTIGKIIGAVVVIIIVVSYLSEGSDIAVSKGSDFLKNLNVDWTSILKVVSVGIVVLLAFWLFLKLAKKLPKQMFKKDDLKSLASNRAAKWTAIGVVCVVGIGLSIWFLKGWGVLIVVIGVIGVLVQAIRMFKVNEGTGTAFKILGKYHGSVMSLKKFHFGQNEFIEPNPGSSSTGICWWLLRIGGWVFYIKWFVEPTRYADQNNADDGFGENYSVFLNQIQRDFTLLMAETKKDEEIPLTLKAAFKMKVVNIYLFLFIAPKDVIAKVIEIMEAITRGWIQANSYDTIQKARSNGTNMWDQFGPEIQSSIKKIKEDWGIEIIEDSIFIMDIGLTPEDQKAYAAKKRQKLLTAAGAQEILGGMLEVAALSLGAKDGDEARKKLEETLEGKKKLEIMVDRSNQIVAQRALGVKPILFGNADGSSLDPITAALASLFSLGRGTPGDNTGGSKPGDKPQRGKKTDRKDEKASAETSTESVAGEESSKPLTGDLKKEHEKWKKKYPEE